MNTLFDGVQPSMLRFCAECDVCGASVYFNGEEATHVYNNGDALVAQITCPNCGKDQQTDKLL